jgi:lipopolysaccharide/colanic/teichoic acid biosynthesis glycosyltransferase
MTSTVAAEVSDTAVRRFVDVVVAFVALVMASPLLLLLALLVRRSSRGPAIFRQVRVGRGGKPFTIYKFRTMVEAPSQSPQVSGRADPRITPLGRWMREHRLDELPQLVNVLRGDLTFIGPRPEVPEFVASYTREELRLLAVRPGVLGPGAILFAEEQAEELDRADDPAAYYVRHQLHPKLALDLEYLRTRSLRQDLSLVARTVGVVS